jgi:hypothetical protein
VVRPANELALTPERVVTVSAQTRLEPKVIAPSAEAPGVALHPLGRLEDQTLIERVAGEDVAHFIAGWDVGHYTNLVPGTPQTVDFARLPSRPSIEYRATGADTAVVGAELAIAIDGQPQGPERFPASAGTLRLPALRGVHQVAIATKAPVRLLLDRPPVGGSAQLYALRSVRRIDKRSVRIPVVKRSAAAQNLNIVVYTRSAGGDSDHAIRIRIDDGAPARLRGVAVRKWTLSDRTIAVGAAERPPTLGFASLARGGVLYPRHVAIALGDDLPAGAHTIELSMTGEPEAWVRAFVLDDSGIAPRALQWRDSAEPDGSSP